MPARHAVVEAQRHKSNEPQNRVPAAPKGLDGTAVVAGLLVRPPGPAASAGLPRTGAELSSLPLHAAQRVQLASQIARLHGNSAMQRMVDPGAYELIEAAGPAAIAMGASSAARAEPPGNGRGLGTEVAGAVQRQEAGPGRQAEPGGGSGLVGGVAAGLELVGRIVSLDAVFEPLGAGLQALETAAAARASRSAGAGTDALYAAAGILFTVTQGFLGFVEFVVGTPLGGFANLFRGPALLLRAAVGDYTRQDWNRDLGVAREQVLDGLTLGLRQAWRHIQEARRIRNPFRAGQIVALVAQAIMTIAGLVQGIRGGVRAGAARATEPVITETPAGAGPAVTGAGIGAEATLPGVPPAGARPAVTGAGVGAESTLPGVPPAGARPAVTGVGPGAESTLAGGPPAGARPAVTGAGVGAESTLPGGPPAGARPAVAPSAAALLPGGIPQGLVGIPERMVAARLRDAVRNGQIRATLSLRPGQLHQAEWSALGGRGQAPPAYWENGALRVNLSEVGWPGEAPPPTPTGAGAATAGGP